MDVSQLSDQELRDELKNLGLNVGPIVESTRKVYEKKLLKLTNNAASDSVAADLNVSQPINGNGPTNGSIARNSSPVAKSSSPTPVVEQSPEREVGNESESDYEGEESMRYLTEEEMAADRAAARQLSQSKGTNFGAVISFGVIFAMVAVFAYFIIENAEQLKMVYDEPK